MPPHLVFCSSDCAPDEEGSMDTPTIWASDSLLDAEYLMDVRLTGRGQRQQIEYIFREASDPDQNLVKLLREHRVGMPRAVELATKYPDRVEGAVRYYLQVRREGRVIRNPGGFIADLISKPEKYELVEPSQPEDLERRYKDKAKQALKASEEQAEQEHLIEKARLERSTPEEQWQQRGKALMMALKSVLSTSELKDLEAACRAGEILTIPLLTELAE